EAGKPQDDGGDGDGEVVPDARAVSGELGATRKPDDGNNNQGEKNEANGGGLQSIFESQKSRVVKLWRTWSSPRADDAKEEAKAEDDGTAVAESTKRVTPPPEVQTSGTTENIFTAEQNRKGVRGNGNLKRGRQAGVVSSRNRNLRLGACWLSREDLLGHLEQIQRGTVLFRAALTLLVRRQAEHRRNRGMFNRPVDPVALGLPTYFDIIKHPMDFGTIKGRLERDEYLNPTQFRDDMRLVFSNAMTFNPPATFVHVAAKRSSKQFEQEYAKFERELKAKKEAMETHSCELCKGERCAICGLKCLEFQEPILRCSAPCKARINRNATYYRLGGDRGQHWCNKCFKALPGQFLGILGQAVRKTDLERCVHNEVFPEPWVDCAKCSRHMHQICTLYHPSVVPDKDAFSCALCLLDAGDGGEADVASISQVRTSKRPRVEAEPSPRGPDHRPAGSSPVSSSDSEQSAPEAAGASSGLPTTAPGAGSTAQAASAAEEASGPELGASSLPHSSMGRYLEEEIRAAARRAGSPEVAESLTLRVVSSRDSTTKNKTVLVFQRIHGVDVMVFVLYVQEYPRNCPMPNRGKVYISYLDSVAFMEPSSIRTSVYQQVLISYMAWVKARGFEYCYIWACPPQRGDAYIMFCHPKWQRSPGVERLRKWYGEIVDTCKKQGTVVGETNMYDMHLSFFKPLLNTRSSRARGRGNESDRGAGDGLLSPTMEATLAQINGIGGGEVAPKAAKINRPVEQVPYFYGDYLPNEIESLLMMLASPTTQESARLHSSCDESISVWWKAMWGPQTHAILLNNRVENSLTGASGKEAATTTQNGNTSAPAGAANPAAAPAAAPKTGAPAQSGVVVEPTQAPTWKLRPSADLDEVDFDIGLATPQQRNDWMMRRLAASIKPMSDNFLVLELNKAGSTDLASETSVLHGVTLRKDTSDPDPELPRGLFDTRMEFLDMCKHNTLQFDELRRAKHTSLVLVHYHRKAMVAGLNSITPRKALLNR
ncbi:Histone acetyltransferase p300 (p300 HAT) (E1A-associated protein p300) (Histone butyryltransferase p300) (Histone crotonyltransferase p300) (Protein 2-hydroxyisobutyryltransferase p300) (Protein lactyltransferas p300) (Protein propionyltransferase p300), partial [Durusdinium trenchii]